jgi:hypothetical protein
MLKSPTLSLTELVSASSGCAFLGQWFTVLALRSTVFGLPSYLDFH